MMLSYVDKAIIFLLPLLVFHFFKNQKVYVSIEYIYSVTTVIIPLIDLGLSGYFFYAYRNSNNHEKTLKVFIKSFQRLYLLVALMGVSLIVLNFFGFEFEKYIVFIVSRLLFVLATVFFASYYRLISKPETAVYITLGSNVLSLFFILVYFFADLEFSLWLIFIGQILFSAFYIFKSLWDVFFRPNEKVKTNQIKRLIKNALLFSWPSIIQVFIMMFIANYGKINVLTKLTLNDGVLLSLVQRFSMVVFLTHSSIWAFIIKDIYTDKDIFVIKKSFLYKYLGFLTIAMFCVMIIVGTYINNNHINLTREYFISTLIIIQTFFSCINAYLEMHYGRENKNIIKLYLALITAFVFISILTFLKTDFLERISIAMFFSTFVSLFLSIIVLHKRNYRLI